MRAEFLHVSGNCWLVDPKWVGELWKLWQQFAPSDRDFFLPVSARALDHQERFKCSEATILLQTLETALTINTEPLLCDRVLARLWRENTAHERSTQVAPVHATQRVGTTPLVAGPRCGNGEDHAKTHRTEAKQIGQIKVLGRISERRELEEDLLECRR